MLHEVLYTIFTNIYNIVLFFEQLRNHILYLVENYQTVVVVGETGCGKSTQIPQVGSDGGPQNQPGSTNNEKITCTVETLLFLLNVLLVILI